MQAVQKGKEGGQSVAAACLSIQTNTLKIDQEIVSHAVLQLCSAAS